MRVNPKTYGEMEIDERQIIEFEQGHKTFALLDAIQKPFYWLQSVTDLHVAFILIDPMVFRNDYTLDVSSEDLAMLNITDLEEEALVMAIVTIPEDQTRISANLQGPVVINKKTRKAMQFISLNNSYKTKHFILDEMALVRNAAC